VNRQRKAEQQFAASKLKTLKEKFYELVNKIVEIDVACQQLENEIQQLRQKIDTLKSQKTTYSHFFTQTHSPLSTLSHTHTHTHHILSF
jgi:uncharacterized coiled-coil DUF342 family protein